jgi:cation transport ATPase
MAVTFMAIARPSGSQLPATDGPPSSAAASSGSLCPGCGQGVDPLRAGHVAVLEGRFRYFCRAECKRQYLESRGRPQDEDVATASPPEVASYIRPKVDRVARAEKRSEPPPPPAPSPTPPPVEEPDSEPGASDAPPTLPSPERPLRPHHPQGSSARAGSVSRFEGVLAAVDAVGVACGALVPAIGLLGASADVARVPLVLAACAALSLRLAFGQRAPADPHPLVVLAPSLGAVAAACWARAAHDPRATPIAALAGLGCAAGIIVESLVARARQRVQADRERVERALDVRVRAVQGEETIDLPAAEVRPGEQVVVEAGELVGVDAVVTAGEARVVPWLDAKVEVVRREGDPIVAGARVVASRLRMTTTWSGRERAWVRLLGSPASRIDVEAPTARALRHTVERGIGLAAAVVGISAVAANAKPVEIVAAMCAGAMAFGSKALVSLVALHFARAHLDALGCGITYKDPRAFERAASSNIAVLSARGTVLMGEPEIVAVEAVGRSEPGGSEQGDAGWVLSLAAGAETASTHPFAAAILRAARTRGVRPDHVRNATAHAGLGVTALTSTGERLVVGGRAIMLEEKIGVAVADTRVTELEAQGRSVLLVAVADRLVGLIALQDGLRAGARAAVQRLLDARIEPILLSGEARDTCETIGRALDIEHVRPEVLPADRGAEVRALAEGGNVVAVVGHPSGDDGALGAADVAVAMGAAGSTPGEWAVALASDDVRDAAMALAIPHETRDRVRAAIAIGATPGLIALLAIGFGIAPLAVAPVAALLGAVGVGAYISRALQVTPRTR